MIVLHLSLTLAAIQAVTQETADTAFNRNGHLPMFLKVWSPWCSECSRFAPIFEAVSNIPQFTDKIAFASFNCHDHRAFCDAQHWTFPSFRFINRDLTDSIPYIGTDTVESLSSFLEKQLQRDLVELPPDANLSEIASNFMSAFVFSYPKDDSVIGAIATKLGTTFRITETRFFYRPSEKRSLVVYRSDHIVREFEGSWTEGEIIFFVVDHCLPFLAALSPLSMHHAIRQRKFCVIIFMETIADRDQLFEWNLTDVPNVQYTYSLIKPGDKILARMGRKTQTEALFAVVNFTKQVWWTSTGNFTEDELNRLVKVAVSDKGLKLGQGPGSAKASIINRWVAHLAGRMGVDPSTLMPILVSAGVLFLILVTVWRGMREKLKQD
jgi:hypothetical protein